MFAFACRDDDEDDMSNPESLRNAIAEFKPVSPTFHISITLSLNHNKSQCVFSESQIQVHAHCDLKS